MEKMSKWYSVKSWTWTIGIVLWALLWLVIIVWTQVHNVESGDWIGSLGDIAEGALMYLGVLYIKDKWSKRKEQEDNDTKTRQ
jgi:hypothetical protein